ncbi:MAG: hypothetical protein NT027_10435 [Proteobacteria bacterium]|nr:hypothetical protein [Pseudomonadota bacterium]
MSRVIHGDADLNHDLRYLACEYFGLMIDERQMLARDDYYSYSVIYSADQKTDQEIRQRFFDFLISVQSATKDASIERTYQLNFDLIPWA